MAHSQGTVMHLYSHAQQASYTHHLSITFITLLICAQVFSKGKQMPTAITFLVSVCYVCMCVTKNINLDGFWSCFLVPARGPLV